MFAGVFDEFFGVPTHPLAVHAPVVLVPIAAVVAVVLAVKSDWRVRIGWLKPAAVFVLVAMLFVAKESGESAKEADNVFGDIAQHEDLANATFVLAIVWFVLTLAVTIRDWMTGRDQQVQPLSAGAAVVSRDTVAQVLVVLAAVAAVITTIWLIRTGHAGAESRWKLD
jgi:preprotein translocase subunit SecG